MPELTKISTHKLQGQIFTEIQYIPSRSQIKHNLPKYPGEKLRSEQFLYHEMPKMVKSYLTTSMDELSTKLRSLF